MIKNIFWDFDGVIIDSMPIREFGFRRIFKDFNKEKVELLIDFHIENGGLSRFFKIRYFFTEILNQKITEKDVLIYANRFSNFMRVELTQKDLLIKNSLDYIIANRFKNFHIVSGSEEKELKFLCEELEISSYFISIHGSPKRKEKIVEEIIEQNKYNVDQTILIGDSVNDFNAAKENKIKFYGFNNLNLEEVSDTYIYDFNNLKI